jgi:alpha-1,6-mannosyltransferase
LSAWAFAALLGYAALGPGTVMFEGISWQRALVTSVFLAACAAYLIWLLATTRTRQSEATGFVAALAPGAPALLAALVAPPISRDPWLYLHYGSMALDGVNPYLVRSGAVDGPYSHIMHWDQTCAYGPLALALFMVAALVKQPAIAILLLKVLWLCAHLAGSYAFWRSRAEQRTLLTQAYAFNPVLLFAFVVDVHLDALAGALFLWGLLALAHDRARLALLVFCTATLTKSLMLLALPLWFAWALSRRRYHLMAFGIALAGGLVVLLTASLLPTVDAWRSLSNPISNTGRSIQHALVLSGPWGGFDGLRLSNSYGAIARVIYLLGASYVWLRGVRSHAYDAYQLASDFALLWLLACLFVVPFVPWWYSAPVISATLWSPRAVWLRPVAMTFGICSAMTLAVGTAMTTAGLMAALLSIVPSAALLAWSVRHERARAGAASPA